MKNTTLVIIGLFILAYTAQATLQINATFTNTSASSFTCLINMNNTAAENVSTVIYLSSSCSGTLYYNTTICIKNVSINLTKTITHTPIECENLTCIGSVGSCDNESNGTFQAAQINIPGTNCTTTTASTTTTLPQTLQPDMVVTPLWGLNDGGNMTGLGNTTGLGTTVLGISKNNFLRLASLLIITIVLISLSRQSVKTGVITSIVTADILILVIKWLDIPITLFLLINLMAVIIFAAGGRR